MTATNHAVTGVVIVAAVNNPFISVPLALLSHFFLDALPHFGAHTVASAKSKEFKAILKTDGLLLISFLIIISYATYVIGMNWWLLALGGIVAVSPDIMWYKHYQNDIRGEEKKWGPIRTVHKKVQNWEVSWGWIIEMIWFMVFIIILNKLIF